MLIILFVVLVMVQAMATRAAFFGLATLRVMIQDAVSSLVLEVDVQVALIMAIDHSDCAATTRTGRTVTDFGAMGRCGSSRGLGLSKSAARVRLTSTKHVRAASE